MASWLYALIALVVMVAATPLLVWLLQDTKRSRRGGGFGPALGELNAIFDPSRRHVEATREQRAIDRPSGDPPADDPEEAGQ